MIFSSKVYEKGKKYQQFAILPKSIIGKNGNSVIIFLQRYDLEYIDGAHGKIYVGGEYIGKDYWDH